MVPEGQVHWTGAVLEYAEAVLIYAEEELHPAAKVSVPSLHPATLAVFVPLAVTLQSD